jgi:hypothetical protein
MTRTIIPIIELPSAREDCGNAVKQSILPAHSIGDPATFAGTLSFTGEPAIDPAQRTRIRRVRHA